MSPEVVAAVEEIKAHFPASQVSIGADAQGGACVIVEDIQLGLPYTQDSTWFGFHITHACPYADVYPHFVRGDLARADGASLGQGLSSGHQFPQPAVVPDGSLPSRSAVQISRRSNNRMSGSTLETPLIKLMKVLQWLRSR